MAMPVFHRWGVVVLMGFLGLGSAAFPEAAHVLPWNLQAANKTAGSGTAQVRATLQPAYTIPVEPLGFAAPGAFYLGARISQTSLDFLDEDRLLFTFRIPGLIRRDTNSKDDSGKERRIRAVVLHVPQGTVDAETIWTVHDYVRYLIPLDRGQFLFRDRNALLLGGPSLELKPFLNFPGDVESVEVDPTRKYLVTISTEPPTTKPAAGEVPSPPSASATVTTGEEPRRTQDDLILRILHRDSGQVMLVSHVRAMIHLPMDAEGYLEPVRGEGSNWQIEFHSFRGETKTLGHLESACSPMLNYISPQVFLVTGCNSSGDPRLTAISSKGRKLWENPSVGPSVWPLLVMSPDGSRLARESLMATHEVNAYAPLEPGDIRGQDVQIINSADGKVVLRAAARPVLDAGGNVAISPSGRRVAILMEGGIRVFELPPAPPLHENGGDKPDR